MEKKVAIYAEGLSKSYKLYDKPSDRLKEVLHPFRKQYHRKHYSLRNISFSIEKGETVGIIGKNGAGKSTLLKIITGVLTPTEGRVHVDGKVAALLELGAGFNPDFTGIENIYMNGMVIGYTREEMTAKLDEIVNFADIGDFIDQPVKMYSSGMFARLAFALSINIDPEILIVDEALSVGDTRFQIKCMNKMKQMMDGGTTVLFVTHDINAVRRFCTKAIWLNEGTLKAIGETNKVSDQYLDYLKCGEIDVISESQEVGETVLINKVDYLPKDVIAEIVNFKILNEDRKPIDEAELDGFLRIEVFYEVYDENIDNPVLGIAVKGADDDYVCGLNTLLDKVKIPWKYGKNKFALEYPYGIRAISGKYYFDVALFEETATVPIQYIAHIKRLSIISDYVGEGRYIIPHEWRHSYE